MQKIKFFDECFILFDIFFSFFYNKFMKDLKKVKDQTKKPAKPVKEKEKLKTGAPKQKPNKAQAVKNPIDKKMLVIIISIISVAVIAAVTIAIVCIVSGKNKPAQLAAIEVMVAGKTTGYSAFDQFDDDGMALRVRYQDGTEDVVYDGWSYCYVSTDAETVYHTDHFYAGETKVKIDYGGKSCFLSIEKVAKLVQDYQIELTEYSQIKTGQNVAFPMQYLSLTKLDGAAAENNKLEFVYCTNFTNYLDYAPATSSEGTQTLGGAPSKAGFYKVFAKIPGDKNHKDVFSNVVEFALIDEQEIAICAKQGEQFFGFKELADATAANPNVPNQISPNYIEFEVATEGENRVIKYYSTFAESGNVMIFSDHITLINGLKKTQISFKNDKISYQNAQNVTKMLTKWNIPAYLGTYKMTISQQVADLLNMSTLGGKVCTLQIGYDNVKKDGVVYFTLDIARIGTDEIWHDETLVGVVNHAINTDGESSLVFTAVGSNTVEKLFALEDIDVNVRLNSILVSMTGDERAVSNGTYQRQI